MQALLDWFQAHLVVISPLIVALVDFIFALKPDWAANGLVHWAWLQVLSVLQKGSAPKVPPAA